MKVTNYFRAVRRRPDRAVKLDEWIVDCEGNVLAITLEHASARTDVRRVTVEGLAA